ncbi:hypothetical protein BGZ93_010204 [Podila epicladia]|nr:hypothetical protein BGZ92_009065 [Podila epicladia]KAG0098822.1 hypothetical protein BGZ93_010204 [Podila epicladia]
MPPPTSYYHSPGKETTPDTDDLILQVERIHDPAVLKRMLIEKEQERQDLASNLDLAARLGLGLQQQLEQVEMESYAKLQSLQDQNLVLQSKANRSKELSTQLAGSEHEVKTLTGHNHFLQRELDSCRRDLKTFRQELDELTEQMAEMGAEMMDAKIKVNSYARRLGEVEQELATTQELNVNLQVQLENALHRQKQTHSSTTQAVKLIQSDLGKVFSESDTMRLTLEELESRQIKCEGKVFEMMTNTREYAQLLEEAQDTIHNLRLESDLEGRGWSRVAIWDDKTGTDPSEDMYPEGSSTRKAVLDSQSRVEDLREHKKKLAQQAQAQDSELDPDLDPGLWDGFTPGGNSLGLELERGDSEGRFGGDSTLDDPRYSDASPRSPQLNTLSSELGMEEGSTFGDFANRITPLTEDQQASEDATEPSPLSPSMNDIDDELSLDTIHISTPRSTPSVSQFFIAVGSRTLSQMPQRLSLSAELHQRLEENNILQNVLTGANLPWSAGGQRSPNSIRAEVNRTLQHHLHLASAAPGSPRIARTGMSSSSGSASSSTIGLEARIGLHGSSGLASSGSSASLPGSANKTGSTGTTTSPVNNRSRGSIVLENQSTLGLKYLLSATSSADLSNVITKTKAKGSASSVASTSSTNSSVSSLMGEKKSPTISISASAASSSSASARRTSSPSHVEPPVRARASSTSKPWSTSTSFTASRPAPIKTTGANIRGVSPGRASPGVSPIPRGSTASPSGKASGNKSTQASTPSPTVTRRSSLPSLLGKSSSASKPPSKTRPA